MTSKAEMVRDLRSRRDRLQTQLDMMEGGVFRTHSGPSLIENDTTPESIAATKAQIAELDRLLSQHAVDAGD